MSGLDGVPAEECPPDQTALATLHQASPRQETIVLAHGCFDLLHAGHIDHLLEAKRLGDRLVVSITADEHIRKGAWRPCYTAQERARHLRTLSFVDQVLICDSPTAIPAINCVKPGIYVKGIDYASAIDGALAEEITAVQQHGGIFIPTSAVKQSSSRLLARVQHGDILGDYLDTLRRKGAWATIETAFERARKLSVAFIGETIIDEYRFCAPLGKPSKEFVIAVAEQTVEEYEGGVMAAKRHAEKLCNASVVTQPTGELRKTRYLGDFGRKLFEVYSSPKLELPAAEKMRFYSDLVDASYYADAVVLIDFGHGLMDGFRHLIEAKFLALNAQSNAGNQGFNPVIAYPKADYVCVDLPEARLATQMQHRAIPEVVACLSQMMPIKNLIVTNGKEGAYWTGGKVPALATQPRDTIGAGDAFLAITAPLIAAGLETEYAAFCGNVAGAMKTEIVGHRSAIDADVLYRSIRSLLK